MSIDLQIKVLRDVIFSLFAHPNPQIRLKCVSFTDVGLEKTYCRGLFRTKADQCCIRNTKCFAMVLIC